jgi:hypothetical protein
MAISLVLGYAPPSSASHASPIVTPATLYQAHGTTVVLRASAGAAGVEISFEVAGSSNPTAQANVDYADNGATRDLACVTAADGSCTVSYADQTTEDTSDTVRVWADEDLADGILGPGEAYFDAAVSWLPDLSLDVIPESANSRTGQLHTVTAAVVDASGTGRSGIPIDFEIIAGPGDDDVGTAGNTPSAPDLGCFTSGGAAGVPATCSVSWTEGLNVGGDDLIVAWIDMDANDSTVEADLGEGIASTAPLMPGCALGANGSGFVAEPDYTDCVTKSWSQRVPSFVDAWPEVATQTAGQTVTATAAVLDQDGNPLVGPGTSFEVRWFFEGTSPNDPGSQGNNADLRCWTGNVGECSVTYVPAHSGTDLLCALVAGSRSRCSEPLDAIEFDTSADLVQRVITIEAEPTPTPTPTPDPTPTPTLDPTPTPTLDPTPTPTPDPAATPSPDPQATPEPTPAPTPEPSPFPSPTPMPPTPDPTPSPSLAAASPTPEPHPLTDAGEALTPSPQPTESPPPNPSPTPEPTEAPWQAPSAELPPGPSAPAATAPEPAPAPAAAADDPSAIGQVISAAAAQVSRVVRPEAAAAIATEFGFPILLTVAVLAFLVIQNKVDRRDPKLRMAPRNAYETYLKFETEEQL